MRITTSVVLFYIWLTAAANLLIETGFASAMGIALNTSAGDQLAEAVQALGDIEAGGLSAESLLGVYTVVTSAANGFLVGLTAAPRIMIGLGIPLVFVTFIHAPLGLLAARFGIYMLAERSA